MIHSAVNAILSYVSEIRESTANVTLANIFISIYIIFILHIYKINARIGIENVIDEWKAVRSEVET